MNTYNIITNTNDKTRELLKRKRDKINSRKVRQKIMDLFNIKKAEDNSKTFNHKLYYETGNANYEHVNGNDSSDTDENDTSENDTSENDISENDTNENDTNEDIN